MALSRARARRGGGRTARALAVCTIVGCASSVRAQALEDAVGPDQAVEAYLERLGLKRVLAEQLAARLAAAPKDQRVPVAERLGKIYVELLTGAPDQGEQELWERRSRELLETVPEADTFDLRLSLDKAIYLRAESTVESGRLRLATPEALAEAERSLRQLQPRFKDIGVRTHRRVEQLEKIEEAGDATDALVAELAEARRQRSLAFYYSGWCNYYIAYLTRSEPPAIEALKDFGWLLNAAGGRAPAVDRLPENLLRYEHIARAAVGCALASALRGNDTEAVRWLDAVEESEEPPESVRGQLLPRRMIVLAGAKRWADLEAIVRRARRADRSGGGPSVEPLPPLLARLLAVLTLEAETRVGGQQVSGLAQTALGDLVVRQEVGHVRDLVARYGTAPLGETGFIVNYVRGAQEYDRAREAHKAAGADPDEPTTDPAAANLYRSAIGLLEGSLNQADASSFGAERGRAAAMLGRASFYVGDFGPAATRFLKAWELLGRGAEAEEALWLAVVSGERAAKGAASGQGSAARERFEEAAALFLRTYPDSDRAPRLVLMRAGSGGGVSDEKALQILSDVAKDSPVYGAARKQVARILYDRFRAARGGERDFAALRFVAVAEEVLAMERAAATGAEGAEARRAADRAVIRVRQILDALLGVSSPDADRAEAALKVLDAVAVYNNMSLADQEAELSYRRLQIALARDREDEALALADAILAMGPKAGQFGAAAERLVFRRLAVRWRAATGEAALATARRVVEYGSRIIDRSADDPRVLSDPGMLGLYSTVAAAGAAVHQATQDAAARDTAIRLDRAILDVQPRAEESLRRLASLSESAGDFATALECRSVMLSAAKPNTDAWFESRYETIRLLGRSDPDRARALMAQHKTLYPAYGPAPWGDKLRELDGQLGAAAAPALPAARPAASGGAG